MTQELPLNIERKPMQLFGITMNKPLPNGSHALTGCKTNFFTTEETEQGDTRNIIVQYDFEISALIDGFEFKLKIVRPFGLKPLSKITPKGVYQCAIICKDEGQDYINNLFSEYPTKPETKIEPYEELEPHILELIESFYQ